MNSVVRVAAYLDSVVEVPSPIVGVHVAESRIDASLRGHSV